MYGILIEGVRCMIIDQFGAETWTQCLERAHVRTDSFSTHERYAETIIPSILTALAEITGKTVDAVGMQAGKYFVHFMGRFGYADFLRVLGRRFGDLLRELDNVHEYFRFSYAKLNSPSFYCEREDKRGLLLHYRTRRQGFIGYVIGQLVEIGKQFYDLDIEVKVLCKEQRRHVQYIVMRVNFDNPDYKSLNELKAKCFDLTRHLSVDPLVFLQMFPFHIMFNKNMVISSTGRALDCLAPWLRGTKVDEEFDLLRPFIKFSPEGCKHHINNVFQLESYRPLLFRKESMFKFQVNDVVEDAVDLPTAEPATPSDDSEGIRITLKGQMVYLKQFETFLFVGTCTLETLDQMLAMGIFLNDFSISDWNRDIIMASVQKSDRLKELLIEERQKSLELVANFKKTRAAKQKTKQLLMEMMPKFVAIKLIKDPETNIRTICEVFDQVTIAFCKVVDFPKFTRELETLDVMKLLNTVFSLFDQVVDRHGVYKVETVGESYMISCGVPVRTPFHAEYVVDVALDWLATLREFSKDDQNGLPPVDIKIGMHSGSVVGGIVGLKTPRYCLFGDTVNCASRMESTNKQPMTIQISEPCKVALEKINAKYFKFQSRGLISVKGKGEMEIYEVILKQGPARCDLHPITENHSDEDSDDDDGSDVHSQLDETSLDTSSAYGSAHSRLSTDHNFASSNRNRSGQSRAASRATEHSGTSLQMRRRDDFEEFQPFFVETTQPQPPNMFPSAFNEKFVEEKLKIMENSPSTRSLNNSEEISTKPTNFLEVPNESDGTLTKIPTAAEDVDEPRDLAPQNSGRIGSEADNASIKSLQPSSIKRTSFFPQETNGFKSEPQTKETSLDLFQIFPTKKPCVCSIL